MPTIRGWILIKETFKTNYWEPCPVLGAQRKTSGSLFPHKLQILLSKDPTAMGRAGFAFLQIHSTKQGTQQQLQAPWGHLATTSPRPHPER